ncbi:hypothetical protein ABPG75_000142 [Micractinium tetrahymenae]
MAAAGRGTSLGCSEDRVRVSRSAAHSNQRWSLLSQRTETACSAELRPPSDLQRHGTSRAFESLVANSSRAIEASNTRAFGTVTSMAGTRMQDLARLQAATRVPGVAVSPAVDFLIAGLNGLHFVAYGSTQGSVVVACARQLDHIGSTQDRADQAAGEQLQTLLVLDLQQPAGVSATAFGVTPSGSSGSRGSTHAASGPPAAAAEGQGPPLADPVLQVAYGGGPHLLLAACTHDNLVVVSLEGLAAHLYQQQTSGGEGSGCGGGSGSAAPHPLWHQLAAVHCGAAEVLAISWTQQLDGILTSSSDGMLTMWHMRPLKQAQHAQQAQPQQPGVATPPAAELRAAWSARATIPQRLVCAGVSVYAPSATAVGQATAPGVAAGSPLKSSPLKGQPGSTAGAGSAGSSPARDGDRYASVWWPQAREQRQRHYAGGMPAVGQEKLRHPTVVTGLQWSPGVLQKDVLASAGANGAAPPARGSPSWASIAEPGSPTTAAAVAATEAEDHPALMTVTEDGTVRVWVETLVLTEGPSPGGPLATPGQPSPGPPSHLRRRSPSAGSGAGSPGAAPSSPRDARAAAAAAAALGAAAPAITSYFCMALVIDAAATAVGTAAAAGAAGEASPARSGAGGPAGSAAGSARPHVALWGRHAAPLLLQKQQRRVASPVLWLFTATVESRAGGTACRLYLHLHAVRGLAAIVMSAGYGGSLSSTSGGSSSTRPAAVLWGQHSWDLPAAELAGASLPQLLQRLCCWVSEEEGYPLLHAFTSGAAQGSGRLLLAGRTFATVQEDGPLGSQVHKQLAVVSSWHTAAVAHEHPITAFSASSACCSSSSSSGGGGSGSRGGPPALVASCDSGGQLLLWSGPRLEPLAAVPAAAVGASAALVWLPLAGAGSGAGPTADGVGQQQAQQQAQQQQAQQHWLAVGSGSMLQCYAVGSKKAVAVSTAALPAGCSSILSLHVLEGSSPPSCLMLAVCSSSAGRGSVACVWRCTAPPGAAGPAGPAGPAGSLQLDLAGTAQVPATAAVTAAAVAGGQQIVLGMADGAVLLATLAVGSSGVQLQQSARLEEQGPVAAVAADEHCLHIASASRAGISVWAAAADSSGGDTEPTSTAWHYSHAAHVALPAGCGAASAIAWLHHSVAPCLAVATSCNSILLLSSVRDAAGSGDTNGGCGSSWQWVAALPAAVGGAAAGGMHLAAGIGGSSVVAAAGSQLLRLSEEVLVPPAGGCGAQDGGNATKLLGRLLLNCAGPLPQYHPSFLAALLLAGKRGMAAAVFQRLVAWLTALQRQAEAAALGDAGVQPPSPGMHMAGVASDQPAPSFAGLPLAEMADPEQLQLPALLERSAAAAAGETQVPGPAKPPAQQQQQQQQPAQASQAETGMLDLAAFGMATPAAAEPVAQQQQPAASSMKSGMLDLAAFGMVPAAAAAAPQQAAASSGMDSGMLDLAAFGMAPPPAAEPVPQQQAAATSSRSSTAEVLAGTAANGGAAAAGRARAQHLAPPEQPILQAPQLLPVAADCYQQLQALLRPRSAAEEGDGEVAAGSGDLGMAAGKDKAPLSSGASLQHLLRGESPSGPSVAAPIPGLTLAETEAVLAIAGAFSAGAAGSTGGSSSGPSSLGVDTAAAHFITAVSLACATHGAKQSTSRHLRQQQQISLQPQQRVTVMNAAGVAFTLAPSSVVSEDEAGSGQEGGSVGQRWGLLAGLDATALFWALLSGTEEEMLQQSLRRLQQLEAAASAAAAAAESSDNAAFLAVKAAKAEPALEAVSSWEQLRQLGAGFWLRDPRALASIAERLAKQQFAARRNADDCALLYCALGRRTVLQGLYRSTQNRKLAEFLARDFGQEQHQQAAQKNAFVLMGQHRQELAAAFFILGGAPDSAIGVAAHDMKDPQLALLLCRLLHGGAGSPAEQRLLQQLREAAEGAGSSDATAAAAACCWLQGDADSAVSLMLRTEWAKLQAAATAEHAAQLLPLLHLLLRARPPRRAEHHADWQRQLRRCLCALAAALQGCGLHALAVQAAVAARLDRVRESSGPAGQQHELLEQLLAVALLPGVLEQAERGARHPEGDAAYQLELLQQQGVALDAPAILARLRRLRRGMLAPGGGGRESGAWGAPTASSQQRSLERQHSSGGSSYRSRDSEQARWGQQRHGTAVVGDGQVLFRVDNDKLEGVACCALMSPDVLGRPVVVASQRHGLVEGQLHVVLPEPLSPLAEAPDSAEAAAAAMAEEEQQQRGGVFSRLLSQLFDQSTWQQDPTWHHGTAEFDVVGAAAEAPGSGGSPLGRVWAHGVHTAAVAAHPSKQLYLSGCGSGRLHLWQFGEQQALATYTPVPGSELASINRSFSGLLSFSRSFKQSSAAPRLANWGKAAAVRFAPSGERFAAVGEGGVVATWRLDAPSRQALAAPCSAHALADGDGHGCAEWWHQALSKQGCAVDFVGGSSNVLVVGGRCLPSSSSSLLSGACSSNLSVWDTMAPAASACVGWLANHQATVTAVAMLPGGWLLAAGDGDGGLSCTDLRMMGGSSGPRLLWSVKVARGALRSIVAVPGAGGPVGAGLQLGRGGGGALLATAGADGAVRVWRSADGRLLQSVESAHFSSRPPSAGSRRSSYDGGAAPLSPSLGSHPPPGSHPLPVTGLAASEEGLVSVGADGCVRLFSFVA